MSRSLILPFLGGTFEHNFFALGSGDSNRQICKSSHAREIAMRDVEILN